MQTTTTPAGPTPIERQSVLRTLKSQRLLKTEVLAGLVGDNITATRSDKTRESWGQGAANMITGFFGGIVTLIPMAALVAVMILVAARRVAHVVAVERTESVQDGERVATYTVNGELFFAASNDLYAQFEYAMRGRPGGTLGAGH